MKRLKSYINFELIKTRKQANWLLLPLIFYITYLYSFYSSFETTYNGWKYELKSLDKFTYWYFSVVDITSLFMILVTLMVSFHLVWVDRNQWEFFRFLPVKLSTIHCSKILIGIGICTILFTISISFIYTYYLYSSYNLFQKTSLNLYWSSFVFSYIETLVFFVFCYSLCYLFRKILYNYTLIAIFMPFLRHFLPIFPFSSLYSSLRYHTNSLNIFLTLFVISGILLYFINKTKP